MKKEKTIYVFTIADVLDILLWGAGFCILFVSLLQDYMGLEGWTTWERAHWAPANRTVPEALVFFVVCVLGIWWRCLRRKRNTSTHRQLQAAKELHSLLQVSLLSLYRQHDPRGDAEHLEAACPASAEAEKQGSGDHSEAACDCGATRYNVILDRIQRALAKYNESGK